MIDEQFLLLRGFVFDCESRGGKAFSRAVGPHVHLQIWISGDGKATEGVSWFLGKNPRYIDSPSREHLDFLLWTMTRPEPATT